MARYTIVPEHSRLLIDARSSVHPIHSVATGLEGFIDLDGGDNGGFGALSKAHVSFPVAKLSADNPLERRELQKRLDARRFPAIDGVLTGTQPLDAGRFRLHGDLSFRGVTRSVTGDVEIVALEEQSIRLEGESTFDIRDFGMEPPRILMLRVEPQVKVRIEVVALRAEAHE